MVFRDDNPNCEKDKRYKAIARWDHLVDGKPQISLRSFYSADAIHFAPGHIIADNGAYDSLNVAFWDRQSGKYRCYFRHFHKKGAAT